VRCEFGHLVSTLTDDEAAQFDRAIVERAFKAIAVDQPGGYWNLRTPEGEMTSATISVADQPRISHFSANRPPGYGCVPEFWNAMFGVLHQTRTVLFWPAGGPKPHCGLVNPDMIPQVPASLIEAIGEPAFVTSGAEIDALMEHSFSRGHGLQRSLNDRRR
jgi:hypothetical protein